jgi:hypothetical protein
MEQQAMGLSFGPQVIAEANPLLPLAEAVLAALEAALGTAMPAFTEAVQQGCGAGSPARWPRCHSS